MIYEPISGNATARPIPKQPQRGDPVIVSVTTRTQDDIVVPYEITWTNGHVYKVDRVFGCKKQMSGDMQYSIRIGTRNTKIWRRPDDTWYVKLR